jgi:hypothetical protein
MFLLSMLAMSAATDTLTQGRSKGDPSCRAIAASAPEPLQAAATPIDLDVLGVKSLKGFVSGFGLEITSNDPRFSDIRVSPHYGVYHRCGRRVEVRTNRSGPKAEYAAQIAVSEQFGMAAVGSGGFAAAKAGAIPVVEGYKVVASWPVFGPGPRTYLGLMRPVTGQPTTLLVRFANPEAKAPTRILTNLPMVFDRISTLPDLHRNEYHVSLEGRHLNGPYRQLGLTFQDETP